MILVTGATGFIGRRVVAKLASQGKSVRCLLRPSSDPQPLKDLGIEIHRGDVTDAASLPGAIKDVETVIHLVAIIRERGKVTFDGLNRGGTANLVNAAKEAGVKRIIHMSAIGVGPDSTYPYLYAKWQGEQAVINSGIPYTVFRSSIVFGPGDEFINALASAVKMGPVVPIIGSGKAKFQPIHVEDVATCFAMALDDEGSVGETIYIGGPEHLTYDGIINIIKETLGAKRLKVHVPTLLMLPVAGLMSGLLPHSPVTPTQLAMLKLDNITDDVDVVEKHFGFKPRPLRGNIDYIKGMGRGEALAIGLGFRSPRHW